METSDLEDTGAPVTWKLRGVAGEFGAARDAGGVGRPADARVFFRTLGSPFRGIFRGEWALLAPEKLSDYATLASREHDLVLAVPWRYESTTVFRPAEGAGGRGLEFTVVPRDVSLERPFGRVRIAYRREGRALRVSKLVEISTPRVGPGDYEEFRLFVNRADRAERREIGVRVAE